MRFGGTLPVITLRVRDGQGPTVRRGLWRGAKRRAKDRNEVKPETARPEKQWPSPRLRDTPKLLTPKPCHPIKMP